MVNTLLLQKLSQQIFSDTIILCIMKINLKLIIIKWNVVSFPYPFHNKIQPTKVTQF